MKKFKVIAKETQKVIGVEYIDDNGDWNWYYNEMQGNELVRFEGKGRIISNDYELEYVLIEDDEVFDECDYENCQNPENCIDCWNCGGKGKLLRDDKIVYNKCTVCNGCGKLHK